MSTLPLYTGLYTKYIAPNYLRHICCTGWRRLIGSPKLLIIFHQRATEYRSLLRKMTYKDKGSYESSPPCTIIFYGICMYTLKALNVDHCNTLQHTATYCNILQLTATHCNTLQHTTTHHNTLQHTATHGNTRQHTATHCNTLQHTATHHNTLHNTTYIAPYCTILH